jgi:hypothetical protein
MGFLDVALKLLNAPKLSLKAEPGYGCCTPVRLRSI